MLALLLLLSVAPAHQGPFFNGIDFGSCLTPDRETVDIRNVELLQEPEYVLDSSVGSVRIRLNEQRYQIGFVTSPDEVVVGNVGKIVGEMIRLPTFL